MVFTKDKKKGFTIVELVIVIAVIGILSAILIPTFSGLISDSKEVAKQSALANSYTEYVAKNSNTGIFLSKEEIFICYEDSLYEFKDNKYSILKTSENIEVTSSNAESLGYVKVDYKCNSLDVYYKQDVVAGPTNPDDELQTSLMTAWNEAKVALDLDNQRVVMFAKESAESGYYYLYSFSGNSTYVLSVPNPVASEEIETDYTFHKETSYNGYYVVET